MIVAAVVAMMAVVDLRARRASGFGAARDDSRHRSWTRRAGSSAPSTSGRPAGRAGVTRRIAAARTTLAKSMGTIGVIQSDPTTGSLRFVGRLDGYLTDASTRSAASIALRYVRAHRTAFGLRASDLRSFRLRRDSVDISGTHHLSWVQRAGGLSVFGQGLHAAVTADGRLVNVTGGPVRGLRAPTAHGAPQRGRRDRGRQGRRAGCGHQGRSRHRHAGAVPDGPRRAPRMEDRDPREPQPRRISRWSTPSPVTSCTAQHDRRRRPRADGQHGRRHLALLLQQRSRRTAAAHPPPTPTSGRCTTRSRTSSVCPARTPTPSCSGNNAWVFKDVKDDSFPDPNDSIEPTSGSAGAGFQFDFLTDAVRQRHAGEPELQP